MRYLTLEAVSDEYDNAPGLAFADAPRYEGFMADRGGERDVSLIAHDIVEHQNGIRSIGPIWDELEAMGGIWHARGRWGNIGNGMHSPAENVASDIVRMARDVSFKGFRDFDAMGFRLPAVKPHDHDEDFLEILAIAREQIPGELDAEAPLDIDAYLSETLNRMRIGFRKATRRFGDRFGSSNQFSAIADAVTSAARHIEFEGQRFRLAWGGGECRITEIYDGEFYE